jgi:general nucleoside transport system permease protein
VRAINLLAKTAKELLRTVATIVAALLVGALLLMAAGYSPLDAYSALVTGAFGSLSRFAETMVKATTLIIIGIGMSIAFRAKMWNIGGEGQYMMGSILAVAVGLYVPGPAFLMIPLTMIMAFLGGAIWSGIPGFLKTKFNANEVITTLMFNYVALYFLNWIIRGPMKDPEGFGFPQSRMLNEVLHLPSILPGTRLHAGLILALLLVVLAALFWRSKTGFRIQMVGESHEVSRYSGLNVPRTLLLSMILSGGIAGLAGWSEVFGIHFRLIDSISSGYGTLGIVVALLGNLEPVGILVSSVFFAALLTGGTSMQSLAGMPFSLVIVIEGLVIIFTISRVLLARGGWKRARKLLHRQHTDQPA